MRRKKLTSNGSNHTCVIVMNMLYVILVCYRMLCNSHLQYIVFFEGFACTVCTLTVQFACTVCTMYSSHVQCAQCTVRLYSVHNEQFACTLCTMYSSTLGFLWIGPSTLSHSISCLITQKTGETSRLGG